MFTQLNRVKPIKTGYLNRFFCLSDERFPMLNIIYPTFLLFFSNLESLIKSLACCGVMSECLSFLAMWLVQTPVSGSGSGIITQVRKAQRQLQRSASKSKISNGQVFSVTRFISGPPVYLDLNSEYKRYTVFCSFIFKGPWYPLNN